MKCIENNNGSKLIMRVKDDVAADLVATGKWKYIAKKSWKKAGRSYGPRKSHE